jgi:hypothetical protein
VISPQRGDLTAEIAEIAERKGTEVLAAEWTDDLTTQG